MVFVRARFLSGCGRSFWLPAQTLGQCKEQFEETKGVPANLLVLYCNGKRLVDEDCVLEDNANVDVALTLNGGKGGFGSMLRALGAQIEKTTNKEACRDLSGRRLRDINEESRLKKYVEKAAEKEREKASKKEAKMEKLRKLLDPKIGGGGKHEFHDAEYNKERALATERVHDAMEQAFRVDDEAGPSSASPPGSASTSASSSTSTSTSPQPTTSSEGATSKKRAGSPIRASCSKKGLWLGVDLDDSDLDSSSGSEEDPDRDDQPPGETAAAVRQAGKGKGKGKSSTKPHGVAVEAAVAACT